MFFDSSGFFLDNGQEYFSAMIITEKRKLNEKEMAEFVFGIVKTLENKYGSNIKFEDDLLIINVEVLHKQLTHQHEDKGE